MNKIKEKNMILPPYCELDELVDSDRVFLTCKATQTAPRFFYASKNEGTRNYSLVYYARGARPQWEEFLIASDMGGVNTFLTKNWESQSHARQYAKFLKAVLRISHNSIFLGSTQDFESFLISKAKELLLKNNIKMLEE